MLIVLCKNEGFILEVQKYRLKAFENFVSNFFVSIKVLSRERFLHMTKFDLCYSVNLKIVKSTLFKRVLTDVSAMLPSLAYQTKYAWSYVARARVCNRTRELLF